MICWAKVEESNVGAQGGLRTGNGRSQKHGLREKNGCGWMEHWWNSYVCKYSDNLLHQLAVIDCKWQNVSNIIKGRELLSECCSWHWNWTHGPKTSQGFNDHLKRLQEEDRATTSVLKYREGLEKTDNYVDYCNKIVLGWKQTPHRLHLSPATFKLLLWHFIWGGLWRTLNHLWSLLQSACEWCLCWMLPSRTQRRPFLDLESWFFLCSFPAPA